MRIIAFITDASSIRDLLAHCGEPAAPPRIVSARKRHDERTEQPVAAEIGRLNRPIGFPRFRSARSNLRSVAKVRARGRGRRTAYPLPARDCQARGASQSTAVSRQIAM